MAKEMGLDEFLGHKSSNYSGKGDKLDNWKKRKPPEIDVFIHTRSSIVALWHHGQPRIVGFTDRESSKKKIMVFGGDWNCWEDEDVLLEQRHRDEESGRRIKPPVICPECLLIEWTYEQIDSGELSWTQPMFRYEAKDSEDPVIVHAGGLCGLFNKRNLTDEEKEQVYKAKIRRKEAWKQNQMAKLSYVFSVVEAQKPDAGICIATEPNLLGDKVKEVIRKAMMATEDEANPFKHPYAIRWTKNPDETEFSKMYDAMAMPRIPVTPEILKLIVEDDPPNIAKTIARQNPIELQAILEEACVVKGVPWDRIFGRAIKAWKSEEGKKGSKSDGTDFDPEELESKKTKPKAQAKSKVAKDRVCEECGDIIKTGMKRCPGCDKRVDPEGSPVGNDDIPYG